jgi:hypothetical protein
MSLNAGGVGLTRIETVLIYAGIPALVIKVVFGLVFGAETLRGGGRRYRPGRPYEFRPVWFLSAPERDTATLPARGMPDPDPDPVAQWPAGNRTPLTATGGASDHW